jgi:hypothetical protein
MQPVSFPTPLGQARIYLYSQNVDMRNYAVLEIMQSCPALGAVGGARA